MHGVCLHEHDILSILLLLVNVSGLGSLLSHTALTCTALRGSLARRHPPLRRSGLKLGQVGVGGDFGSSSGRRGMFEPVARQRGRF